MFRFGAFSLADAETVLGWRYPAPYDFYDAASDGDDAALFLQDGYRREHLIAARDDAGRLRGFLEFHLRGGVVEVGLGLSPEDTGRGLGLAFVEAGLAYAREIYRPHAFSLYVAAFNARAIKVYERAGFRETGRETRHLLGRAWEFLIMERPA